MAGACANTSGAVAPEVGPARMRQATGVPAGRNRLEAELTRISLTCPAPID